MAFSRQKAFDRWINKLKERKTTMLANGKSNEAERIDREIKKELKDHGV